MAGRYSFRRGSTKPLRVTLQRASGRPIKLGPPTVDQSVVTFTMENAASGTKIVDNLPANVLEGTVIPPGDEEYDPADPLRVYAAGRVQYEWDALEVAAPGLFRARFKITTVAGDTESIPNTDDFSIQIT